MFNTAKRTRQDAREVPLIQHSLASPSRSNELPVALITTSNIEPNLRIDTHSEQRRNLQDIIIYYLTLTTTPLVRIITTKTRTDNQTPDTTHSIIVLTPEIDATLEEQTERPKTLTNARDLEAHLGHVASSIRGHLPHIDSNAWQGRHTEDIENTTEPARLEQATKLEEVRRGDWTREEPEDVKMRMPPTGTISDLESTNEPKDTSTTTKRNNGPIAENRAPTSRHSLKKIR